MKGSGQLPVCSATDRIWKASRPSLPEGVESAGADDPNEMRRRMLQSQEFRTIMPSAEVKAADKGGKEFDRATIDTAFACLAICTSEEHRAMSFVSIAGANAMRRAMYSITKKFALS